MLVFFMVMGKCWQLRISRYVLDWNRNQGEAKTSSQGLDILHLNFITDKVISLIN